MAYLNHIFYKEKTCKIIHWLKPKLLHIQYISASLFSKIRICDNLWIDPGKHLTHPTSRLLSLCLALFFLQILILLSCCRDIHYENFWPACHAIYIHCKRTRTELLHLEKLLLFSISSMVFFYLCLYWIKNDCCLFICDVLYTGAVSEEILRGG